MIVWVDERGANPDVYAQRVDASGNVLWSADGVPLSTASGAQTELSAISDGWGGAIVAWKDTRGGTDIYAQRVNATGSPVWTADGVPVSVATDLQETPALAADGAFGAIVAWEDRRIGEWDVFAQRIDGCRPAIGGAGRRWPCRQDRSVGKAWRLAARPEEAADPAGAAGGRVLPAHRAPVPRQARRRDRSLSAVFRGVVCTPARESGPCVFPDWPRHGDASLTAPIGGARMRARPPVATSISIGIASRSFGMVTNRRCDRGRSPQSCQHRKAFPASTQDPARRSFRLPQTRIIPP